MTPDLDDVAYEAALVAYDAKGLTGALEAAYQIYLDAGQTHATALEQARQTCAIIEGDAAYEQFLGKNDPDLIL